MILLLSGEETFLRQRFEKKCIEERLPKEARDFNLDIFEGSSVKASKLLEIAQTFPAFSTSRMIVLRDADDLPRSEMEVLEGNWKLIPESTDLIFIADKIDKRLNFWKKLLDLAKHHEFLPMDDARATAWLMDESKAEQVTLENSAARFLVMALGTDAALLLHSLEKLILLVGGKNQKITLADVEKEIAGVRWQNVFALTEAVGQGQIGKALQLYESMLDAGESSIALVALLARHFRLLEQACGREPIVGIPPRFAAVYEQQSRKLGVQKVKEGRESLFQADWDLKRSKMPEKMLMENLIMGLCPR